MKKIPKEQLLMGIHSLFEILSHASDRLLHVYVAKGNLKGRKEEIVSLCQQKKIPITFLSFDQLTDLVDSDSHQSFVALIKPSFFHTVSSFLEGLSPDEPALVLCIDQIFDPQNFGALIRSAECLGAKAIVWSKNRGVDLTPTVRKASCGASEILPLIRVSNLYQAMQAFQEEGFEAVAAMIDEKTESVFSFSFSEKTFLIVGSEGEGIQPLLAKKADRSIYIPMQGKISSLNVAQASAILLANWLQKAEGYT